MAANTTANLNFVDVPTITTKPGDYLIALSGQQNTGKTTTFNALTGMHQHTGNWPGLTVELAQGRFSYKDQGYTIVDLPGTYSLFTASHDETISASFIISGQAACTLVVADANSLERNLMLLLQIIELTDNVILCVNLMDEAKRRGVSVDFKMLEKDLGIPVVGIAAGPGWGLEELRSKIKEVSSGELHPHPKRQICSDDDDGMTRIHKLEGSSQDEADKIVKGLVYRAEEIAGRAVTKTEDTPSVKRQKAIDKVIMGRGGILVALILLFFVFWITIYGANYISEGLGFVFGKITDALWNVATNINAPTILAAPIIDGIWTVATDVISVMLPPMAIFFPCFTLLEDLGYLPRVAFRLDRVFQCCGACGKQSLTMCMGFGCSAAGVTGCRIIDSPRERLIAILTTTLVPCNGRFPTLIMLITIFFSTSNMFAPVISALLLTLFVVIGIAGTFLISKILSVTILKGQPSSFVLEIPPYRKPQILQVIVRSVVDRTLKVLGRALCIAAPAGLIIWILANITVGDATIIQHIANFLNPLGLLLGMNGIILVAFILGSPANELVLPIAIMMLTATGVMSSADNTAYVGELLTMAGWTWKTALCMMVFCLFHWPCATTCMTIKKETGSWGWTAVGIIVPTLLGVIVCMLLNLVLSFI